MRMNGLWIDDVPKPGAIVRNCLISNGFDLDIATSRYEAMHRLNSHYDTIFMRPELKLDGTGSFDLSEVIQDERIPFLPQIMSAIREGPNSQTTLYLVSHDGEFFNESGRQFRDALKHVVLPQHKLGDLTHVIYLGDIIPAVFAYDVQEHLLRQELAKFIERRNRSRVDG
ncbi:MAG: hypothetical protein AABW48_05345 [Nanoarchaeota archaeon]